jgi:hypothetical protein
VTDFPGYLCWDTAIADGAINTEAVVASPAVFVATHTPLRIRKAQIRSRSLALMEGTTDENTVLSDFLSRNSDTGALLMPVVGDTGTGKSHLIRWVRNNIPPADNYCMIYLEKSRTSLKAVIETLLADAEGAALAKLKNDIGSFSAGLDETALARRLINALNESLAQTAPGDMSGTSRILAGARGLASILQDPYIQEHLLGSGKFISRLAADLLRDRNGPDSQERPPGFALDDLPLQLSDPRQAAKISRTLLNHLLTSPGLKTAAVDLLNQHLEAAVRNACQLGTGRLYAAMLQVRQEYARQGKEIILLVEDFALIQGVQRELLDAITEPAVREGTVKYAPIRTLLAVTTGYFTDLPETVMSRVAAATTGYVYDLDVPFSRGADGTEEIVSFTGRYLNAARIGRQELDRLGVGHVPNKCDGCAFRSECHEAFGTSAEGFGLYPFNGSALTRAVHSVHSLTASTREWFFVARTALGSVIRPMLIEDAAALEDGAFPDQRFRERFPGAGIDHALPSTAELVVDEYDKLDPDRRKLILEFWGDAPASPNDIDPGVLMAFALQPLPADADVRHGDRGRGRGRTKADATGRRETAPSGSGDRASLARKIQSVEEWGGARRQQLPGDVAREIRIVLADAVARRYTFRSPLMQELTMAVVEKAWPRNSSVISIDGAGGERLSGTEAAAIQFPRTALSSQFFQSLLRAKDDTRSARAEDIRRLAATAEENAAALTAALQRYLEISDTELTRGLRASLLGAALAGRVWPGSDETELLSAAFEDGSGWTRGDHALRTRQWRDALESHLRHRGAVVDRLRASLGIAQGTGAVRMIDAARAVPLLRAAAARWTWDPEEYVPGWVKPAVTGFSRWEALVDEQLAVLNRSLSVVRQLLPVGVSGSDTHEAVRRSLQESGKVGLAPSREDALRIQVLLERAGNASWRVISELDDDLGKARSSHGSQGARVFAAARDRGDSLGTIQEFLTASDQWLEYALASAASRSDQAGDDAAQQVKRLLQNWGGLYVEEGEDR